MGPGEFYLVNLAWGWFLDDYLDKFRKKCLQAYKKINISIKVLVSFLCFSGHTVQPAGF